MTEHVPRHEIYGLTSQFRSAAVSIAANIAEGYRKKDYKNELNFLNLAHSSLEECRYPTILSTELGYKTDTRLTEPADEAGKLLNAYSKAIVSNHSIS